MPLSHILPSGRRPARLRALASGLILATVATAIAACGSSQTTGTSADPAAAVPASAALYAGAVVRPTGVLQTDALAAGRALSHQPSPYLRVAELLRTPGSPPIDFHRDLAAWLGARAGVFSTPSSAAPGPSGVEELLSPLLQGLLGGAPAANSFPFATHGLQGAIVMDTRDAARARAFLDAEATRAGAHRSGYRGVNYQVTAGGLAFGVVDRFAVIGSESGLRGVIETSQGGPSLARAPGYAGLLAAAPSAALAHAYAKPGVGRSNGGGQAGRSGKGIEPQGLEGLVQLLGGTRQLNVSVVPSSSSIALDADALAAGAAGSPGGLLSGGSKAARALGELPGESWLGIGLEDLRTTLGADVQGLRILASLGGSLGGPTTPQQPALLAGLSVNGLLGALLAPLLALGANNAEARHDFQNWMGSAGIFASGSGLLELRGAAVIESKNPALSRAAVARLGDALRKAGNSLSAVSIPGTDASLAVTLKGLPLALDIADGRDANGNSRFVIGLGPASVAAALHPSSTLSGAASHAAAVSALGEGIQPSVMLDVPTLLGLLEGVGLSEDPTISKFVPYLKSLTTVAGGGKSLGGGVERFRLVLGLRPAA